MEINEGLDLLIRMLKNEEWFCDAIFENNRYIVYVKELNLSVYNAVPEKMASKQVLVHFDNGSRNVRAENYNSTPLNIIPEPVEEIIDVTEDAEYLGQDVPGYLDGSIAELNKELDRLEKICGSNTLQDVFYETHDGKNAVTNLSCRFPEVSNIMSELYKQYGFDVIYEELDG